MFSQLASAVRRVERLREGHREREERDVTGFCVEGWFAIALARNTASAGPKANPGSPEGERIAICRPARNPVEGACLRSAV